MLHAPTAGRILLDGIDIKEFDPDELRAQVGAMFQDYVTYQATAKENIGLGSLPELEDDAAVALAAQRGGAEELVKGLPHEWETMLGKWFDEGVNLSGGEWQKVALSPAIMRDVRILVLDEPTSALDTQAEFEFSGRLNSASASLASSMLSGSGQLNHGISPRTSVRPFWSMPYLALWPCAALLPPQTRGYLTTETRCLICSGMGVSFAPESAL